MQFSWEISCFTHKYGMYSLHLIIRQVLFFLLFNGDIVYVTRAFLENALTFMESIYDDTQSDKFFCLLRNRTVPDLPPKNYFGRFSKEVVDARQQGLQDFLIEWVVNKRYKNSFCRQHFCVNQRLLFILQKQCLRYSNVVCTMYSYAWLANEKIYCTRSFVQCPVRIHLAPILQRLDSAIHLRNCSPVDKYSLLKTNFALSSGLFLASERDSTHFIWELRSAKEIIAPTLSNNLSM